MLQTLQTCTSSQSRTGFIRCLKIYIWDMLHPLQISRQMTQHCIGLNNTVEIPVAQSSSQPSGYSCNNVKRSQSEQITSVKHPDTLLKKLHFIVVTHGILVSIIETKASKERIAGNTLLININAEFPLCRASSK